MKRLIYDKFIDYRWLTIIKLLSIIKLSLRSQRFLIVEVSFRLF